VPTAAMAVYSGIPKKPYDPTIVPSKKQKTANVVRQPTSPRTISG
jgi:hypothetical protein